MQEIFVSRNIIAFYLYRKTEKREITSKYRRENSSWLKNIQEKKREN